MRLTLRTLLAYLDDLLEPSQTKELGAKIQESEVATELVAKIRDVIRKRRLTAPVVSGPGCDLDANLVAEYLDNTLSAEGITDLERICLESDVHLAEVAASHQILTLALAEPVDIGTHSRERMYALGEALAKPASAPQAGPGSAVFAKPVVASAGGSAVFAKPAAAGGSAVFAKPTVAPAIPISGLGPAVKSVGGGRPSSASIPVYPPVDSPVVERKPDEPFDRTIPDYLKAPPLWKRALPLAVALLVIVWLGMLFTDQEMLKNLLGGKSDPAVTNQVAGAGNAQGKPADGQPVAQPVDGDEIAQTDSDLKDPTELPTAKEEFEDPEMKEPGPKGEQVAAADKPSLDPPPPADLDDAKPPVKPAAETKPATPSPLAPEPAKTPGTAVAKADTSKPAAAVKPTSDTSKPATVAKPARPVSANPALYDSPDGILLRQDADRSGWYQLPHRAHVFPDEALAIPEPFDAQIYLGKERHRMTVMGPAVAAVIDPVNDLPMGVNLIRGRVILQPAENGNDGGVAAPMKFLLSVQGTTWRLELADVTTRCGIEVTPREPRALEEDFGTQGWSGKLHVWTGSVKITSGAGEEKMLTGPESLVLATDPTAKPESVASKDLPTWERRLSNLSLKNSRLLEKEFTSDKPSAHDALLGLMDSRVYELSRLAVSCLGLIGDEAMLLEVLDRNEHQESRVAAINGLRSWVNQDPENRTKLKTAIAAKFYPNEVDVVYRLVWGYRDDDARNKQTTEQLIKWMEHDRLAVRELAWYYVKSLSNRKLEHFDARGTPMQISTAVIKLRRVFDKDGSLLPQLPKPAVAPDQETK